MDDEHGIPLSFSLFKNHSTALRTTLLTALADWYNRSLDNEQQQRLSRVLEIVQDLKALPILLAAQPMTFILDLACLASRRGYLKLDKWLSDKLRDHQVRHSSIAHRQHIPLAF